jgi:hypothetical protein
MTMIIVLFNLKPGVKAQDYEAWARSTDLPTVNALRSVNEFKVLRSTGLLGSNANAPYQYVELLQINTMEGLFADIGSPVMQKVAAEFQRFAENPQFIVTESIV